MACLQPTPFEWRVYQIAGNLWNYWSIRWVDSILNRGFLARLIEHRQLQIDYEMRTAFN